MQIHHKDYYGNKRIDSCFQFVNNNALYNLCLNDAEKIDFLNTIIARLISILADKKALTESDIRQIVTGDPAE